MWCTRWFLPLLLLPLPTAPPYFLVLFIVSLTIHAKPCFYCIVLLTTLFVSSCYWQPFPIDSPLTTPWSENITTFSEALKGTLSANYTRPFPTVMRAADRCWCDFSGSSNFFEPFNISHWEYTSVQRVSRDLERQSNLDIAAESQQKNKTLEPEEEVVHSDSGNNSTSTASDVPVVTSFWSRLKAFSQMNPLDSTFIPSKNSESSESLDNKEAEDTLPSSSEPQSGIPSPSSSTPLPSLRWEYDLRPYGIGMIIDLGWAR